MISLKSECVKSVSSANQYLFVVKELTLKLENQILGSFNFEKKIDYGEDSDQVSAR